MKSSPKLIDAFMMYDELDLLEIRLHEVGPHVDYFILVEGNKNWQNKLKPFYYEENKERFKDFHDRIIHIKIDDMPGPETAEFYQRSAIDDALVYMKEKFKITDQDCVMISDIDEIPFY